MRTPKQANAFYVDQQRKGSTSWGALCQKLFRTAYGTGGGNASAKAQLAENQRRGTFHKFTGDEDDIPYGAAVFSDKPNGSQFGHIFIAGGRSKSTNKRVFRSNDITRYGGVGSVPLATFRNKWGHVILGWGEYVNGQRIKLGDSPNEARRKQAAKGKGVYDFKVRTMRRGSAGLGHKHHKHDKKGRETWWKKGQRFVVVKEIQKDGLRWGVNPFGNVAPMRNLKRRK